MNVDGLGIAVAFSAGLFSFLSPCVLPLFPSYLSFITGMSVTDLTAERTRAVRGRVLLNAIAFIAGFSIVFVALGASFSVLGQFLLAYRDWIQRAGGVLIVLLGLQITGLLKLGVFGRTVQWQIREKPAGYAGSLAVGVAFAIGWSPCVGTRATATCSPSLVSLSRPSLWRGRRSARPSGAEAGERAVSMQPRRSPQSSCARRGHRGAAARGSESDTHNREGFPMPTDAKCIARMDNEVVVARYDIDDRFTLSPGAPATATIDVWCPLIQDTPYQRVLSVAIGASAPWTVSRDADHGNLILHARLTGLHPADAPVCVRYRVERRRLPHMLDPACVRPLETPALFERALWAEEFVEVSDRTRRLAQEVVGSEQNTLEQARRIYDYVSGTMTYNAAEQSWKGSTEHALTCSVGNCNDIHALFISLCRSVGIPARLVLGQAFEPPAPGQEACDLCGYHCWAEFSVSGLGWIPADASCACKYGTGHLFGDLEMNHVAWSVGRDLLLVPSQRGGRLLFFAGPYAEVDGRPHPVERAIRFTEE